MKEQSNGTNPLLTPEQEQWLTIQKMLTAAQLQTRYVPPPQPWRRVVFAVVMSKPFDFAMIGVIVLNIIFMMMTHAEVRCKHILSVVILPASEEIPLVVGTRA